MDWQAVTELRDLQAALREAATAGRPAVVGIHADWCSYCPQYWALLENDPAVCRQLARCAMIRIDVTDDDRTELRKLVGIPAMTQPWISFLDRLGKPIREAALTRWYGERSLARFRRSLGLALAE